MKTARMNLENLFADENKMFQKDEIKNEKNSKSKYVTTCNMIIMFNCKIKYQTLRIRYKNHSLMKTILIPENGLKRLKAVGAITSEYIYMNNLKLGIKDLKTTRKIK